MGKFTTSRSSDTDPLAIRQLPGLLHGRDDIHAHVEALIDPGALVLSLWISAFAFDPGLGMHYLLLSLVIVMMTFPGRSRLHVQRGRMIADLIFLGVTLIALLMFFGWATHYLGFFPSRVAIHWIWIAPTCLVVAHLAFRFAAPRLESGGGLVHNSGTKGGQVGQRRPGRGHIILTGSTGPTGRPMTETQGSTADLSRAAPEGPPHRLDEIIAPVVTTRTLDDSQKSTMRINRE